MTKKNRIARIRTLYAIMIGITALCVGLFFLNVVSAADPIGLPAIGDNSHEYGVIITDLGSGPALYQQQHPVSGMADGLEATATISRFDVNITAAEQQQLHPAKTTWCMVLQIATVLAGIAMTVLVLTALISFYCNVRRGRVFPRRNITWLTWIGALMIVMSLCIDISTYIERSLAVQLLQGSDWQPMPAISIHTTRIFFGLTLIFMAEIFKIGRDMQEEQELTI